MILWYNEFARKSIAETKHSISQTKYHRTITLYYICRLAEVCISTQVLAIRLGTIGIFKYQILIDLRPTCEMQCTGLVVLGSTTWSTKLLASYTGKTSAHGMICNISTILMWD